MPVVAPGDVVRVRVLTSPDAFEDPALERPSPRGFVPRGPRLVVAVHGEGLAQDAGLPGPAALVMQDAGLLWTYAGRLAPWTGAEEGRSRDG